MNKFTINYDTKTIELTFNDENFSFDLNKGDVGDFWYSFQTKDGIVRDINFSQEDKNQEPSFAVYGLFLPDKEKPEQLLINMSDETCIDCEEKIGNPDNYFGVEEKEELNNRELVKRVLVSKGWGENRAETLIEANIDIFYVNIDELESGELTPREVANKMIEAEMQGK